MRCENVLGELPGGVRARERCDILAGNGGRTDALPQSLEVPA